MLLYFDHIVMRQAIIVIFIIWLSIIALVSCTRASDIGGWNKFMADQVYSVYLEKSNYIHEVDSGRVEYNTEIDKGLGIRLDDLCTARERTPKQCWYMMLFEVGAEARVYR
jgi:hypothetical protein